MKGFRYNGQLNGQNTPATLKYIIANSQTVTIGDAINLVGGYATVAGAGAKVMGIVVGIITQKGLGLEIVTPGTDYDGTFTAGGAGVGTYVATSDNATDKKVMVEVIVDKDATFVNDADGDLVVADLGVFFDVVAASDQIDQSSKLTTDGQFQLVGFDPLGDADASVGLFKIAESQLDPYAQIVSGS